MDGNTVAVTRLHGIRELHGPGNMLAVNGQGKKYGKDGEAAAAVVHDGCKSTMFVV
jgi:hypothetical protein